MQCPNCNSSELSKAGKIGEVQRYKCKECSRKFTPKVMFKPKRENIEECCNRLLTDINMKNNMLKLLSFLNDLKMKPVWYHKTSYKCNYKGKRVAYISFYENHCVSIRVCTVSDFHGIGDLDLYLNMLPEELKTEYMNYLANFQSCKDCNGCGGTCAKKRVYRITNPTKEQFEWIEQFIHARREYITNPIV